MNFLKSFFKSLTGIFKSGAAEKVFNKVAELVPKALPIVETIAALTPTRTDDEIVALFEAYGVPLLVKLTDMPAEKRGYLLLDVATETMKKRYPGTSTSVINSAVQLAVAAIKAKE